MAKLEKVAEGVYRRNGRIVVPIRDPVTGKRPWHYPTDYDLPNTITGGKQLKRRLEDEKTRRVKHADETVESFCGRWMDDYPGGRAESTRTHNSERVKAFARDFAGRRLGDVSRREVRRWVIGGVAEPDLAKEARGWAGSIVAPDGSVTVKSHRGNLAALRAMYADARRDHLVSENPFAELQVPKSEGRRRILVLSEAEVNRLADIAVEIHGPEFGQVIAGMILCAAWMGVRPGELFALKWGNLDFKRGRAEIVEQYNAKTGRYDRPKTGERTIVLLPPAGEAIRGVPRHVGDDFVFHTNRGSPFTPRNWHYSWDKIRQRFIGGLPEDHHLRQRLARDPSADLDFYELRHFCATYLLDTLELSPSTVAIQLGHADGGKLVMSTYGHPDQELALDRIQQAFGAQQAMRRATG
jgi:integrase